MKEDWRTISMKSSLLADIKRVLQTPASKELGLTNVTQFVEVAVREKFRLIEFVRFYHISTDDGGMHILDNKLEQIGQIVTVSFRESDTWCDYCSSAECVHVQYAWALPETRKTLEGRGYKQPRIERSDV